MTLQDDGDDYTEDGHVHSEVVMAPADLLPPIVGAIQAGRNLDRLDMLTASQVFLAMNRAKTPLSDMLEGIGRVCVSQKMMPVLDRIAKAQEQTQSLPYHNAAQAAKEAIAFVLVSGMELTEAKLQSGASPFVKGFSQYMDVGLLAIFLRYYRAADIPRTKAVSGECFPELFYYDTAKADGLLDDVHPDMADSVWNALVQSRPVFRTGEPPGEDTLLHRNVSDAVVLPFIALSYELNMLDRIRIRVQNEMDAGERIEYSQATAEAFAPVGSARNTSYEIFARRMIKSGAAFRMRTASISGTLH